MSMFTVSAKELLALTETAATEKERASLAGIHVVANSNLILESTNGSIAARIYSQTFVKGDGEWNDLDFTMRYEPILPLLKQAVKNHIDAVRIEKTDDLSVTVSYFDTSTKTNTIDGFPNIENVYPHEVEDINSISLSFSILDSIKKCVNALCGKKNIVPHISITFSGETKQVTARYPEYSTEFIFMPRN